MLNLPQSTCGYPDHLKIETCRQNALLHTRFVWQTYEFPGHSNENDDVRFGSLADIEAPPPDVRFTPKSRRRETLLGCPLCAKSRHSNHSGDVRERPSLGWSIGRVLVDHAARHGVASHDLLSLQVCNCQHDSINTSCSLAIWHISDA